MSAPAPAPAPPGFVLSGPLLFCDAGLFSHFSPFLDQSAYLSFRSLSRSTKWLSTRKWPGIDFQPSIRWSHVAASPSPLLSAFHSLVNVFRCFPHLSSLGLTGSIESSDHCSEQFRSDVIAIRETRENPEEPATEEAKQAIERRSKPFPVDSAAAGWTTLLFHVLTLDGPSLIQSLRQQPSQHGDLDPSSTVISRSSVLDLCEALRLSPDLSFLRLSLSNLRVLALERLVIDYPLLICLFSSSFPVMKHLRLESVVLVKSERIADPFKHSSNLNALAELIETVITRVKESKSLTTANASSFDSLIPSELKSSTDSRSSFDLRRDSFNEISPVIATNSASAATPSPDSVTVAQLRALVSELRNCPVEYVHLTTHNWMGGGVPLVYPDIRFYGFLPEYFAQLFSWCSANVLNFHRQLCVQRDEDMAHFSPLLMPHLLELVYDHGAASVSDYLRLAAFPLTRLTLLPSIYSTPQWEPELFMGLTNADDSSNYIRSNSGSLNFDSLRHSLKYLELYNRSHFVGKITWPHLKRFTQLQALWIDYNCPNGKLIDFPDGPDSFPTVIVFNLPRTVKCFWVSFTFYDYDAANKAFQLFAEGIDENEHQVASMFDLAAFLNDFTAEQSEYRQENEIGADFVPPALEILLVELFGRVIFWRKDTQHCSVRLINDPQIQQYRAEWNITQEPEIA